MNWQLMWDSLPRMLGGLSLTLQLIVGSLALGALVAFAVALLRLSGNRVVETLAAAYVFVFRGTPLLVQIFLVYYGLGQFEFIRDSILWPFLREPYWCAILALTLNTGAYTSEVLRGAILSVPSGQVEAARACGMSRALAFRRIVLPVAIRQMLPAYGNEVILMVKATSLASTITLMEVTGIARRMIAQTFAVFELFIVAGAIYLVLNFIATRLIKFAEWRLTPYLRARA
ncbi:ABC transporter permease [Azospirillum sp. TSH100]|uniref:ABC transporter permease n=1 Tax=Azospirillum lipoferum TaxID=193 RepID=A0A5A9GT55_AZOLI|nr:MULTISPECIES: ABC transporter permease [Azospirillum]KAA0597537.1 ABC transporter permease [Azospirillum lipoferum]MCP1610350.1 octopine/nopaline transport system permease protein [Azospirillum lipoferum]MDW5534157.1 ABC transporter permease [Azospirillum sp. NL1]PWC88681.1 ABC transporter permease [Azospirillum sp. TSH100]QCG86969.1 ABC transporter permease [Azospirillum sp. TSH100]